MHLFLILLGAVIGLFIVICIIAFVAGLLSKGSDISRDELRQTFQRFIDGTDGKWDWDDFISCPLKDPRFEVMRQRCAKLDDEFPPEAKGQYCGSKGIEVIREYIRELENESARSV